MLDMPIALVGFGEAGSTFAEAAGWRAQARAYDIAPERRGVMRKAGVSACATLGETLADAPLALSLVTADAALQVTTDSAPFLREDAIFCDMNSVAPATKAAAEAVCVSAGKHYVDVAILAPVRPAALDVPLLVSGAAAENAAGLLKTCGFTNVSLAGRQVGRASAIKLVRSIMVKGIEALTGEMMMAAGRLGVTDDVLESLDRSEREAGWKQRAAYNMGRMREHGRRRAAEMDEAIAMLEAVDIDPVMTRATAARQREQAGDANGGDVAA
ncbi:DUF1932 domain-containing protein [Parasphingopyxis lamellibrachiae]|uniref:3-hydroxyisobutyrate dehydrogenase-like beta-hydroxyacid dehydrogenase n=1 Tax=Parasphingopyxis lamellibrachiae TaxID=680125 RepID=A0A3D9FID9_9SPHN|nr:NAD(P)-dependent oxidoreductase [Parasphingopyxis lamellibrachiae]RED17332.1 3-hydroxyisobutyrate dehydrogenase-like beta-hydroxyacid dehydrogenase [Parasphingopyxis lamellibrachiae]